MANDSILATAPSWGRLSEVLRFFRRWPVFSALILLLVLVTGTTAQWIAPHNERTGDILDRHQQPGLIGGNPEFLMGTDHLGRDILSRVIYGSRVSLVVAGIVIALAATSGTLAGLVSGYFGGWIDEVMMRLVDGIIAMPLIVVVLVLAVVLGPSFGLLIGVLTVGSWPTFARVVRGETLVLKELDYVALAKVAGVSTPRILIRHLLPGVINSVVVVATASVSGVILSEAGLSFLGVGIPPPTPSWGGMVADGRAYLVTAWWVAVFPGSAIGLTTLAFVFLGDWLRDRFDPRLRQID